MQKILTSLMNQAGQAVEKIAALVSRATPTQSQNKAAAQTSALQWAADFARWTPKQLDTLLVALERKELASLLYSLNGKKCLYLNPGFADHLPLIERQHPLQIVELDISRLSSEAPNVSANTLPLRARASVERLPFQSDSFDVVFYPSASAWRSDFSALIPEVSRCLCEGGRLIFSSVHPFLEYALNPAEGFKKNIHVLFALLRKHGFFVEELQEGGSESAALQGLALPQKLLRELRARAGEPLILSVKGIRLPKRKKK